MIINNNTRLFESGNWNEYDLNPLTRIHQRPSLVPAAAVIPAPIAYISVVAIKKLVVRPWVGSTGPPRGGCTGRLAPASNALVALTGRVVPPALFL